MLYDGSLFLPCANFRAIPTTISPFLLFQNAPAGTVDGRRIRHATHLFLVYVLPSWSRCRVVLFMYYRFVRTKEEILAAAEAAKLKDAEGELDQGML